MDIAGVDVEIDVIRELPELEDLEVNPSTEDQSFNSSKYGFKNVIIKGIKGEELDLNPGTTEQNVEGVFTKVKVNAIKTQKLNTVPSTQEQVITGLFDEVTVNAIEGEELNLNPSEEQQNFEGVFLGVNINPIQVEEITTDLDFSSGDAIELKPQEGAYIKKTTINKPSNLSPENIKSGETVCGISGINADTSDADATSDDIIAGKTAYVANEKIAGTYIPLDTSDATATAEDIAKDKTAYVNGEKVTGIKEVVDTDVKIDLASYATGTSIKDAVGNTSGIINLLKKVDFSNTDLSKVTSMANMFNSCFKLTEATGIKADNITDMSNLFIYCDLLEKVEISNTDNLTKANYMFGSCKKLVSVTPFNTSKVQNFAYMFQNCNVLNSISLDLSSANVITNILQNCKALTDIKKFSNLGKAYTEQTENKVQYKLDLSTCTNLTHDSLMVVINGLYDLNLSYNVAGGGTLATQQIILGSTNLAKLTAEEIAVATNKGWTVS